MGMLACLGGGCTVATDVSLSEHAPGQGDVTVSVTLDRAALAAVGGLAQLRSQLAVGDLTAAGWSVSGPAATLAGGAAVTVQHGFTTDIEAHRLLADVAGGRVFRVFLSSHRTFWRTYYRLSGAVDLSCGLGCFGDAGLQAATGSPVGVDPVPLSWAAGQSAPSVFRFSVDARLPGGARTPAGAPRPDGSVGWTPELGKVVELAAGSSTLNTTAVATVAGGGAAGLVAVGTGTGLLLWRRRRRRRRRQAQGQQPPGEQPPGQPGRGEPPPGETVTPPS